MGSVVGKSDFWNAMAAEERLYVVDGVFSRRTFKESYFEESGIIVQNNDARFSVVVEKIGGYFLPWFFWQRSWYHGLRLFFSVFARVWACCDRIFYLFANTRPPN